MQRLIAIVFRFIGPVGRNPDVCGLFVGKANNPAHQNPGLPEDLSTKMKLLDELCSLLEKMGKKVERLYY